MLKRISAILGAFICAFFANFGIIKTAFADSQDSIQTYVYKTNFEKLPISIQDNNTGTWFCSVDFYFQIEINATYKYSATFDEYENINEIFVSFVFYKSLPKASDPYDRELQEFSRFIISDEMVNSDFYYVNYNTKSNFKIIQNVGTSGGGKVVSPSNTPAYSNINATYYTFYRTYDKAGEYISGDPIVSYETAAMFKYTRKAATITYDTAVPGSNNTGTINGIQFKYAPEILSNGPQKATIYTFETLGLNANNNRNCIDIVIFDGDTWGNLGEQTFYFGDPLSTISNDYYKNGYQIGYDAAVDDLSNTIYNDGYNKGYETGKETGETIGYTRGVSEGLKNSSPVEFLGTIFETLRYIFEYKIFGVISVGTLIFIPVFLSLTFFILRIIRGA